MSDTPSRRELLKRLGAVGATIAGAGGAAALGRDPGGDPSAKASGGMLVRSYRVEEGGGPAMAIARGPSTTGAEGPPSARELVQRAVDAMGGMRRFVSNQDVVVVKPNIGWDRAPIHAANTNPEVVAKVVELAYDAGAKHVVVTDASCNEAGRCFTRSGIWKAAYDAGAEVILPTEPRFKRMRLRGEVLDDWPVFSPLLEADKVINLPVAKHHNLAGYTGAMKNWYGSLGGRRNRLHQNIDVSVADLATFMQPTLTILDAVRVLLRNGPQGGNIADAKDLHIVAASVDQVAVDAFGCTLIGKRPEDIPYLQMGESRGLGTVDWARLRVVEG